MLGLLLAGCQVFQGTATTELNRPDDPPNDRNNNKVVSVDRIVYVGTGGDLFTIKADGTDPQQLTGNNQLRADQPETTESQEPGEPAEPQEPGARRIAAAFHSQTLNFSQFYAWPTWSPDGTKLAVSRVQLRSEREATVSIQVIDAITGRADTVYTNEVPALIADGVPHYLYWAPDSQSLGFIASTPRGLTLFVSSFDSPVVSNEAPLTVETGAPLYFSWAKDSQGLLLHSGPE
ncbi:MAG: PD40 domain-containing protein, partial [Bacteroidetes bacterium]|nr:PD40 domain-containing protein [Bacteroidota bacterium]